MPLEFRRGTDAERATITPASGEPIWTTDTKELYVGDGTTVGGILAGGGGGSTSTSSLINGSATLHLNADGTLDLPGDAISTTATSLTLENNNTTVEVNADGVLISTTATDSSHSALQINESGSTTFEPPHANGYAVWAINKPTYSARIVTDTYSNGPTTSNVWTGRKARGSAAAPTAAQSGDLLLRVAGTGYGTTEFENTSSGYMDILATENFTDGAHGTKFNFVTTDAGSNAQSSVLVLQSSGIILSAPDVSATSQAVLINQNGSTQPEPSSTTGGFGLRLFGAGGANSNIVNELYDSTYVPGFTARRARGTASTPTAVQADDVLGRVQGNGFGTTEFATTATGRIEFSAIENFTDTARGTRIAFYANDTGKTTPSLITTMRADGVYVYSTATNGNAMLTVNGTYPTTTFDVPGDDTVIHGLAKPNSASRVTLDAFGTSTPDYSRSGVFSGRRARGTVSAPTAAQAGDVLARINGYGYGTSQFSSTSSAGINIVAAENITDSAAGGEVQIYVQTIGNNSTSTQETIATIDQTGLTVVGGLTATTNVVAGGDISAGDDLIAGGDVVATGNVSGANFTATNNIKASTLTLTGLSSANTGYVLSYNPTTDAVTYDDNNPFNQSLNTTDSPTFVGLTLNGTLSASTWSYGGSTVGLTANGLTLNAPSIPSTGAALTINPSAVTGYADPVGSGTALWAINETGLSTRFLGDTYDATASTFFSGRRARGTASAPTAAQNGDVLNRFNAFGYGATGFGASSSAYINMSAAENFTDTAKGGKILFGTMDIGTTTQSTRLTVDENGLLVNGSVLPSGTQDIGSSGSTWNNVYANNLRSVNNIYFDDATTQTTAWTGSVSTSSVTGLATVAWTGKYDDLIGGPNQALDTTSNVQFAGLTVPGTASLGDTSITGTMFVSGTSSLSSTATFQTGLTTVNLVSSGGFPLNGSGQAPLFNLNGNTPAQITSNFTNGLLPSHIYRAWGQNRPSGTATTNPNPIVYFESARGNPGTPVSIKSGDAIGGMTGVSYDGANWPSYSNQGYNYLGFYANENTQFSGTATTAAGSGFALFIQPAWTQVGVSTTRQRIINCNWTTATNTPPRLNFNIGSGTDGTAPITTSTTGTSYTGYGITVFQLFNGQQNIVGVTDSDTAPDNSAITATNKIVIQNNRKSGVSGRRNPILAGDLMGGLQWNGQNATNSTAGGNRGAEVVAAALDNFATARGTSVSINTVNTGTTNNPSERLYLTDRNMRYRSNDHAFFDASGNTIVTMSTSSIQMNTSLTVGGNGITFPGDGQIQNVAWQPAYLSTYDTSLTQTAANTTNLNVIQIGTVSTASQISLVSNGFQVTNAGLYNIQLSIQFENSSSSSEDVVVWLRQNSTDVAYSSGVVSVPGTHGGANGKTIAAWNYLVPAAASDTFYLYWQPQNTSVFIATQTVGTGTPSAPGVIATVVRER